MASGTPTEKRPPLFPILLLSGLFWLVVGIALVACQEMADPPVNIPPPPATATPASAAAVLEPVTNTIPAAYPAAEETATPPPAYPGRTATATRSSAYPATTATPPPQTTPATADPTLTTIFYLPFMARTGSVAAALPPTATSNPSPTPKPSATPLPTIDFAAVRTELQASGQGLGLVKIGFHTGIGGNSSGLDAWMERLDTAGVPFFLKSVDNAQPLHFAQELMRQSGVPHTLVYRRAGGDFDLPDYDLPPEQAALEHWQRHKEIFPPELDPNLVWFETINEVDKNRAEWLGQFALKTAELALADGYKWAAFGWASGEPEPEQWQTPSMLEFLRLAGNYPDRLAIALHEYSYTTEDIADAYPYKVGRFQELFRIVDQHGIPRPTVLITEWGWTYKNVPPPGEAMQDIAWAARLYAPYPQIKGAAIWFLGSGHAFSGVADQTQRLIDPLMNYTLRNYFVVPPPAVEAPINPELYRP